ncbi:MAG: LysR family transcriptional regulator [Clostridia bacterium]|nr:LysR family transcriptional regulator [Clostridia bacterium]
MEILQLRYFYDSAKYESFAKAAQKHMVPTTSVSAAVKRLEKELNCLLFDRFPNRITLNDNGKRLLHSLSIVFGELDGVTSLLSEQFIDTRDVNILVRAARQEFTRVVIEYKKIYPHSNIKLSFSSHDEDYHNYDIIFDENSDQYSEYIRNEQIHTELYLIVSKNHPLNGKQLTLKQLSNESFITTSEDSSLYTGLLKACKRVGFTPKIPIFCNDMQCYKECVEAGIGIGVCRAGRKANISTKTFDVLDVPDFVVNQTLCIYYNQQANYGNVSHFLNYIIKKNFLAYRDMLTL